MKTFEQFKSQLPVDESLTSTLFKLARLSADVRSVNQSVKKRSLAPLERRLINKMIGRGIVSKLFR